MKRLRAFAGIPLLMIAACSSGSTPMACRCPSGAFGVSVPADRIDDVGSVTATGACSNASFGSGMIYVSEKSVGTCHIVVVFKSGAPEFDADVPLTQGTFECEASCSPMPSSPVAVPELNDAGAAGTR